MNMGSELKNIKTKPSGKMPVAPNSGGNRRNGRKNGFIGSAAITALAMMGVAVALIRFVHSANAAGEGAKGRKADPGEAESAPACLEDAEICGFWTMADYIWNIEDFDPKNPNCRQLGIRSLGLRAEFFDDGTAAIQSLDLAHPDLCDEAKCAWAQKDALDVLAKIADLAIVCEIRNIGGKDYMFADMGSLEMIPEDLREGYYVFVKSRPKYVYSGDDLTGRDLRNYDFSEIAEHIHSLSFGEGTIFPAAFQKPAMLAMERGANPGLGIGGLHDRGITGKGVNVAIIDEPLDMGHPEYKGKIAEYRDFGSGADSSLQGPAVAGLLAGESMGTAPGANIYYAAVPAWEMYDAQYYASALDWIVEINAGLPEGEKIKVACISPNPENPLPWINVDKYLAAFMRAEKEGILVLDCTYEHGAIFGASSCNYENPEDVSLCRPKSAYRIAIAPYHYEGEAQEIYTGEEPDETMLRIPTSYKTLPETVEAGDGTYAYRYRYDSKGQLSWAIPYAAGVLAMGWQVSPGASAGEMIKILFETAHIDERGNRYIFPEAFVECLAHRKN